MPPLGDDARAASTAVTTGGLEERVERAADGLAAAQAVDALEGVVPAHHRAVAADDEQAVVERLEDVLVEDAQAIELRRLDVQLAVEPRVLDRRWRPGRPSP